MRLFMEELGKLGSWFAWLGEDPEDMEQHSCTKTQKLSRLLLGLV
jgi:hypothetical protein